MTAGRRRAPRSPDLADAVDVDIAHPAYEHPAYPSTRPLHAERRISPPRVGSIFCPASRCSTDLQRPSTRLACGLRGFDLARQRPHPPILEVDADGFVELPAGAPKRVRSASPITGPWRSQSPRRVRNTPAGTFTADTRMALRLRSRDAPRRCRRPPQPLALGTCVAPRTRRPGRAARALRVCST